MTELQEAIFEMLQSIHDVCVENKIRYYMVGGTMLGAIRHKGFIPWDDDVDISMPRSDYNKFISLSKEKFPEWMEIRRPEESEVNLGYSKVMNANTTLVEDFRGTRIGGVFIDVFPLDGIGDDREECLAKMKKVQFRTFMLRASQNLSTLDSPQKYVMSFAAKAIGKNRIYKKLLDYTTKLDFDGSRYVANTVGAYGAKELTPREYYGTPQLYPFERGEFFGVQRPDEFLKGVYGNYMELPPVDQRGSRHGLAYLNLQLPYREYCERNGK